MVYSPTMSEPEPIEILRATVRPAWIDYNGHMNAGYYSLAFEEAVEAFLTRIGIGADHVAAGGGSNFTLESHICYLREVVGGDPLRFTVQVLDHDAKRTHLFFRMHQARRDYLAATSEQVGVYVDLATRRATAMPAPARAALAEVARAQRGLARPDRAGRPMGLGRRLEAAQ